uniref:Protein transport protein Sec31A n=1 Tax=Timema monikensis TaxID=170555 RepID=A0A7R9HHZ1_9NEOP|nr:unnamed protein product [Timema monikensis]
MKVKEIDRTVNVAWSPAAQHPIMLAAGTAAQQLDSSFSTSASLELYALNLTEPGLDMDLKASVPSEFRFHKLAWGSYGFGGEHGNGIIVGGCDGGRVQIYSAAKVLAKEEGIIARQDKHTGPVRALDFNHYQSNLLATGASESEIYIWDLNNTDTPMLPGAKSQPAEDVLCISWNKQVQHILASAFTQRCVVWDLRKNEPIIKLSDGSSRIRWKALAWHPEVATQLCLASEEDQTPVIQLWDLRFATSPLKTLEGHKRGVLSVAWCGQDPDLLVSCGKENRILVWNPNSNAPNGEVVCDLTTTNQWLFDVSWCPRNPALIASASFDGHVSVYSLMGGQQQAQTTNKIADSFPGMDQFAQAPPTQQHQVSVDLRKAPKWLRRPCGVSFGFGGKLVMFDSEPSQTQQRLVYVSQVVTETDLISRSAQLEQALQYSQFSDYCQSKASEARTTHEQSQWTFLSAHFEPNPRAEILALLGFNTQDVLDKLNKFLDKTATSKVGNGINVLTNQISGSGQEGFEGTGSAEFDAIAANTHMNGPESLSLDPLRISTGDDPEGLLSQALLLGNIEAAVELCFQEERYADAIILAMTGGSDLLAKAQYLYFQKTKGPLASLISAVVTEDWSHVIKTCEVDSWKEALAATLTHSKNDEYPYLCEQLGDRLESEANGPLALNAHLCYICAGNLNRIVESWTDTFKPNTPAKLQELVELVMILQKAVEQQGRAVQVTGKLAELLSRYASILAAQGSLETALTYLGNSQDVSTSTTREEVCMLRERLYCNLGHKQPYQQQQQQSAVKSQGQGRTPVPRSRNPSGSWQQAPQQQTQQPAYPPSYGNPATSQPLYPVAQHTPVVKPFNPVVTAQPFPAPQVFNPAVAPAPRPFSPAPAFNSVPPGQPAVQGGWSAPPPSSASPGLETKCLCIAPAGNCRSYSPGDPAGSYKNSRDADRGLRWSGSRSKYILDPSVQSGPVISPFSPVPQSALYSGGPINSPAPNLGMYSGAPVNSPGYQGQQFAPAEMYNSADVQVGGTNPGMNAAAQLGAPLNAPPGWNDPPMVKDSARPQLDTTVMSAEHAGTRKWKFHMSHQQVSSALLVVHDYPRPHGSWCPKADYTGLNPITHPLYGSVPAEQVPGNIPNVAMNGGYADPGQQQQQQQQYSQYPSPPLPQQNYHQQQQQQQQVAAPVARVAEPPKPKAPIPEEFMYLQTVFEELRNRCTCAATNPQTKRKLEDVSRKLESLYDALRESRLSSNTLQGLHQMVQLVQIGDYTGCLGLHTQLVSGPDFSQIASFMPGLKVLIQSALQLGVYLQ